MIYSCSRPQHRHRHAHRACFLYGMLARLSASHDTRPTHYRRSAGATSVLLPVMMTPCRRGAPEYASQWARICGASRLRGFVEIDGENRAATYWDAVHLSRMTRGARCTSSPNPPLTPSSFLYAPLHHSPGIPRRPRCDISALRALLAPALASFSTPACTPPPRFDPLARYIAAGRVLYTAKAGLVRPFAIRSPSPPLTSHKLHTYGTSPRAVDAVLSGAPNPPRLRLCILLPGSVLSLPSFIRRPLSLSQLPLPLHLVPPARSLKPPLSKAAQANALPRTSLSLSFFPLTYCRLSIVLVAICITSPAPRAPYHTHPSIVVHRTIWPPRLYSPLPPPPTPSPHALCGAAAPIARNSIMLAHPASPHSPVAFAHASSVAPLPTCASSHTPIHSAHLHTQLLHMLVSSASRHPSSLFLAFPPFLSVPFCHYPRYQGIVPMASVRILPVRRFQGLLGCSVQYFSYSRLSIYTSSPEIVQCLYSSSVVRPPPRVPACVDIGSSSSFLR
ncbi:hypothetical protein C8Q76DRAFT_464675 [Earliella scabrosa]|nr:hypothetical protein C8Q76DRAFT_464675 [Earliella scabrosa]